MLKRIGFGVLSVVLIILAMLCFRWGFNQLAAVRQLDRLPTTQITALAQGVYALAAQVQATNTVLTAPYSKTDVVYYRFKLEEEYRDSDGNTKTRTIDSGESATPFNLVDSSGSVQVNPGYAVSKINWSAKQTYHRKSGNRIYTEYTIQPADRIELLGWYDHSKKTLELSDMPYELRAIVTHNRLKTEGGETLLIASLLISAAAASVAVGLACALIALGIHRYWVFVTVMTIALFATLWSVGLWHLQKDWKHAATLYNERSEGALALNSLQASEDLYTMFALVKRSANQWPDSVLFNIAAQKSFVEPPLDRAIKQRIESRIEDIDNARFEYQWVTWAISGVALLLTIGLIYAALKAIRFKRLVEFIPTSKSTGLAYGIAELYGMIEVDDGKEHLLSKLNGHKCVAYKFAVEERRGSGKNAKWVTVEDGDDCGEFWLEDPEGKVAVNPTGANIVYPEKHVNREGNMRYSEYWLPPYRNIYCLGFAGIADEHADKLSIQNSDDFEYLITTQEEDEVIKSKGAAGFMLTGLALGASLMCSTVLLAGSGSLTPLDLIQVSMVVPLTLLTITGILHYNGIVFLQNRVSKTRADIDTLLQKRHDLWPRLLNTVKGHMGHESKLLAAMSKLRSGQTQLSNNPDQIEKQLTFERKVTQAFTARIESYPELKSNTVVQTFSKQMQRSEDELALIRQGYNDSVELYNTQIESFPDVFLAKLFGFKASNLFNRDE